MYNLHLHRVPTWPAPHRCRPRHQHHPKAFVLRARGRDVVQLQRAAVAELRGTPRIAAVVLQADGAAIHHQETSGCMDNGLVVDLPL